MKTATGANRVPTVVTTGTDPHQSSTTTTTTNPKTATTSGQPPAEKSSAGTTKSGKSKKRPRVSEGSAKAPPKKKEKTAKGTSPRTEYGVKDWLQGLEYPSCAFTNKHVLGHSENTRNAQDKPPQDEGPTVTRILEPERRRLAEEDCSAYLAFEFVAPGETPEKRAEYTRDFVRLKSWVEELLGNPEEPVQRPIALMTSAQSYYVITWQNPETRNTGLGFIKSRLEAHDDESGKLYIPGVARPVEASPFKMKDSKTVWFVNATDVHITHNDIATALQEVFPDEPPSFQARQVATGIFPNGNLVIRFDTPLTWGKKVHLAIRSSPKLLVTVEGGKKCLFCRKPGHSAFDCVAGGPLKAGKPLIPQQDVTMEAPGEDAISTKSSKKSKRRRQSTAPEE